MSDEYIKREDAILTEKQRALYPVGRNGRSYVYGRDRDEYDAIEADIDALENLPDADVRHVVRGHWIWVKDHWECSECRGSRFHDLVLGLDAAFCGRCGAEMSNNEN